MPFPVAPQPIQPGLPIEFSAQLTYWIQMLGGTAKILLFTVVPAVAIGVGVYYWFKFILPARLREAPGFDLAALILTFSLLMLSAGALGLFQSGVETAVWIRICQRQILHRWQFPHQ